MDRKKLDHGEDRNFFDPQFCGPMLTNVDQCGPMLTNVDQCGPMWTGEDQMRPIFKFEYKFLIIFWHCFVFNILATISINIVNMI